MCLHLEAVTRREIRNLLINVPPRFTKSTLVNIMWPSWVWTFQPGFKWIFSSYSLDLVLRDARKCRQLLESSWYQRAFGETVRIARGNNALHRFGNTRGGERFAASVNSSVIGEGADGVVCDDPHNVKDVESETQRASVLTWWDQAMYTRQNDPGTVVRVIIMQRVHVKDLAGHALELGYEHLNLPMEYEPKRQCVTSIGWKDPRTEEGELLWPTRFGAQEVAALKASLGPLGYAAQCQQEPVPKEGAVFEESWMQQRYQELPNQTRVIQAIDSAFKDGVGNDWSVIATWGTDGRNYYLINVWRGRVNMQTLLQTIKDQYHTYLPELVLIEDAASGIPAIQILQEETSIPVVSVPAKGSKMSRAEGVSPLFRARRVWLPEKAPWLVAWILEHVKFPRFTNDDQVDTSAMALAELRMGNADASVAVSHPPRPTPLPPVDREAVHPEEEQDAEEAAIEMLRRTGRLPDQTGEQEQDPYAQRRRQVAQLLDHLQRYRR